MPCTLSHPAAVLPLRRFCPRFLDFPALIAGSMTPDAGYFVHRFDLASFAHTFPGSFVVCLPTGLLILLLFYLVRRPICFLLPMPDRAVLFPLCAKFPSLDMRYVVVLTLSLLLGAWSHSLWDSFTHETGWFVQRLWWLRQPLFSIGSTPLFAYYLLQQFSTVAGAAVLFIAYLQWRRRHGPVPAANFVSEQWRYFLLATLILVPIAIAIPAAIFSARFVHGFLAFRVFLFNAAIYSIRMAVPLVVLAAIAIDIWQRRSLTSKPRCSPDPGL